MGWHRLAHHRGPRSEWSPIQPGRGDDRRRGQLLGGGLLSQYGRQRLLRPDADRALSVGRTTAARGTERNGQGDGSAWVLQLLWWEGQWISSAFPIHQRGMIGQTRCLTSGQADHAMTRAEEKSV